MTIEELEQKSIEQLTDDEAKLLVDHYKQLSAKFTAYEQAVKVISGSTFLILTLLNQLLNKVRMQFFIPKQFLTNTLMIFGTKILQYMINSTSK